MAKGKGLQSPVQKTVSSKGGGKPNLLMGAKRKMKGRR